MFRDCKSGGYNLEGSQANAQRLTNLILLIAIAYTASCLVGLKIRNTGHQKYISGKEELKVRLCGIKSPSLEQPLGIAARNHLQLIVNKNKGNFLVTRAALTWK